MIWLFVSAALAFDQEPWQAVLDHYVDARGRVDYAALHASHALDDYLAALATAPEPTEPHSRTAFWINAYNALTVDLVADNWPITSIRDLDQGQPWTTRHFTVAGQDLTLDAIERRLRAEGDPRIHAAINCASKGCPPLSRQAFAGPSLETQLQAAAARFIGFDGVKIDRSAKAAHFSRIFDWYADDFRVEGDADPAGLEGTLAEAASWAAAHAPADQAAWLRAGGYQADWQDYDWGVNAR